MINLCHELNVVFIIMLVISIFMFTLIVILAYIQMLSHLLGFSDSDLHFSMFFEVTVLLWEKGVSLGLFSHLWQEPVFCYLFCQFKNLLVRFFDNCLSVLIMVDNEANLFEWPDSSAWLYSKVSPALQYVFVTLFSQFRNLVSIFVISFSKVFDTGSVIFS